MKTDGHPSDISVRDFAFALFVGCLLVLPGLWAYTLIDPWEGHYAEVARRILSDNDWVRLSWQSEVFRSKPALTPWLIAASMKMHGLASNGTFSGEMLVNPGLTVWAVRLPFALSGVAGMMSMWLMLAKLVSRRAAYIGLIALGCTPFYLLVARQAITDMPMVAATSSAMCFFMLAVHDGERPLLRVFRGIRIHHAIIFLITAVTLFQVFYNLQYFSGHRQLGPGMHGVNSLLWVSMPFVVGIVVLLILSLIIWPMHTMRDFYMVCTYVCIAVSILAKGPPGAVLAVLVALLYLLSTRQLRLLWKLRILEGTIVVALIALPWHLAMVLRDGNPFLVEYFGHHWLKRAGSGVHMVNKAGEGSFTYFVKQLGYGLWPFVSILPAAIWSAWRVHGTSRHDRLRVFALLWCVTGLVLFTVLKTKYHHYILPVVPGLVLTIALWFDDVWTQRIRYSRPALALGVLISALIGYDIFSRQARLLELSTYRYDRLWPSSTPWSIDLSAPLGCFAVVFCLTGIVLLSRRHVRPKLAALLGSAVLFGYFVGNWYMPAVAPHWGQGQFHHTYYHERQLYGATLRYSSLEDMRRDWPNTRTTVQFRSFIPQEFELGTTMTIRLLTENDSKELSGRVTAIDGQQVTVTVDRALWVVDHSQIPTSGPVSPLLSVDADPLIAWNLHWRSELFWSGGELWSSLPAGHRMFQQGHDPEFLQLLDELGMRGGPIFILTEASQHGRLRTLLTGRIQPNTLRAVGQSNKFTLFRAVLNQAKTPP